MKEKKSFEDLLGLDRDYMMNSAEGYGVKIRKKLSSDILRLVHQIDVDLKELEWVKKNQERWYPDVGITTEEIEEFKEYLEKMVTIFRVKSSK